MDRSIDKFLIILNNLMSEFRSEAFRLTLTNVNGSNNQELDELELRSREVTNFIKYLTVLKDYGENHGEIFADYNILSWYLDNSNLSARDKYNIILFFMKKNTKSGILEQTPILVDLKDLENRGVNKDIAEFIRELVLNNKLQEFMSKKISEMELSELHIYHIIERFKIDLEPYKLVISKIKDHYLDKIDSYDEIDMCVVESVLDEVGVSEDSARAFMSIVKKDYDKRIQRESKEISKPVERLVVESNLISDKEYKLIKKEIKSVYDAYNRRLLVSVNYEEMIRIARLMKKIDYPDYDIENFIREVMKTLNSEIMDSSEVWEYLFKYMDKYAYYMDEDKMNDVLEYLGEMMICDDEDYRFWKNEIIKIINFERIKFNNKYDYEMSLVKGVK